MDVYDKAAIVKGVARLLRENPDPRTAHVIAETYAERVAARIGDASPETMRLLVDTFFAAASGQEEAK